MKVEFHSRALSSMAVPLMLCRGHWSSTHRSSLPHLCKGKAGVLIRSALGWRLHDKETHGSSSRSGPDDLNSPTLCSCPTVETLCRQVPSRRLHVWSSTPVSWKHFSWLTPRSEARRRLQEASSSYLDVLQRVDLRLRRADDVLRPRGRHGHQVQQPLAVLGPLGPLDVQRRLDRRLPQVVNLAVRTSVSRHQGHCTAWHVSKY